MNVQFNFLNSQAFRLCLLSSFLYLNLLAFGKNAEVEKSQQTGNKLYQRVDGRWNSPNTWTLDPSTNVPALRAPSSDDSVVINGKVTIRIKGVKAKYVNILGSGILTITAQSATSGITAHDFGMVEGAGILKFLNVEKPQLPKGDLTAFLGPRGGTVVYENAVSPNISSPSGTYNNLRIVGLKAQNFDFPTSLARIHGNLKIVNAAIIPFRLGNTLIVGGDLSLENVKISFPTSQAQALSLEVKGILKTKQNVKIVTGSFWHAHTLILHNLPHVFGSGSNLDLEKAQLEIRGDGVPKPTSAQSNQVLQPDYLVINVNKGQVVYDKFNVLRPKRSMKIRQGIFKFEVPSSTNTVSVSGDLTVEKSGGLDFSSSNVGLHVAGSLVVLGVALDFTKVKSLRTGRNLMFRDGSFQIIPAHVVSLISEGHFYIDNKSYVWPSASVEFVDSNPVSLVDGKWLRSSYLNISEGMGKALAPLQRLPGKTVINCSYIHWETAETTIDDGNSKAAIAWSPLPFNLVPDTITWFTWDLNWAIGTRGAGAATLYPFPGSQVRYYSDTRRNPTKKSSHRKVHGHMIKQHTPFANSAPSNIKSIAPNLTYSFKVDLVSGSDNLEKNYRLYIDHSNYNYKEEDSLRVLKLNPTTNHWEDVTHWTTDIFTKKKYLWAQENKPFTGGIFVLASKSPGDLWVNPNVIDPPPPAIPGGRMAQAANESLSSPEIELTIFPNPVVENLQVKGFSAATYHLRDTSGKLVQSGKLSRDEAAISMENLRPGLYHLQVTDGKHYRYRRVLKE